MNKNIESKYGMTLGYPWRFYSFVGQTIKGQGHKVTKCKNILKAIEWPA